MLSGPGHGAPGKWPCWIPALQSQLSPRVGRRHGNVEPSCSADAPAQMLRCTLSGILVSGLQHKGTEKTAPEAGFSKAKKFISEKGEAKFDKTGCSGYRAADS